MAELSLSIMNHDNDCAEHLRQQLKMFEVQHNVRVKISVLNWDTAWADMVKMALYGVGPDMSEIGSTWIGNFAAMNALEVFEEREIASLGPLSNFRPAIWGSELDVQHKQYRAFPWLAYTRAFFYRTDLFEQAGVDPEKCFQSPTQLAQALQQLTEKGLAKPLSLSTTEPFDSLHNIASWIWTHGGDFVSADGRRLLFNRPEARSGIRAYFDLYRFVQPEIDPDAAFRNGDSAIVLSSPQLWTTEMLGNIPSKISGKIGAASLFNAPFIGASHLVVWKHSRQSRLALNLIRHLMSAPVQANYAVQAGMLPSRSDVMQQPAYASDKNIQALSQSLDSGRSFPNVSMWGMIEDKLSHALIEIWREIFAQSQSDIDAIIRQQIDPLADRLAELLTHQL